MKTYRRTPCASCPYRVAARRRFWHRDHFVRLLENERLDFGPPYQCHEGGKLPEEERDTCIGWLLLQLKNGIPSISLRLHLIRNKDAAHQATEAHSGGAKLFTSVKAMCLANGVR